MQDQHLDLLCRSDEPGAWFAMLPLEMVYDYDPLPPQPDYGEAEDISEDRERLHSHSGDTLEFDGNTNAEAVSEAMSEDEDHPAEAMSDVGESPV